MQAASSDPQPVSPPAGHATHLLILNIHSRAVRCQPPPVAPVVAVGAQRYTPHIVLLELLFQLLLSSIDGLLLLLLLPLLGLLSFALQLMTGAGRRYCINRQSQVAYKTRMELQLLERISSSRTKPVPTPSTPTQATGRSVLADQAIFVKASSTHTHIHWPRATKRHTCEDRQ